MEQQPPTRDLDAGRQTGIHVYYNGACPVCRTEIDHYRRLAGRRGVTGIAWTDITTRAGLLAPWGVDDDAIVRRLHVVDADGRLLAGVDGFIEVWKRLPRYGWLARLASVGWIKPIADWLYDKVLAAALYRWNKATGRVPPAPTTPAV
jgi:predicted DCC family thiol-disulfide oxidoreductase YuxK